MNDLNTHLSEEQMDDFLIGDLAAEPAAHLAACNVCQARVAEMEMPFASFREVSLAWAERRSATMPSRPEAPAGYRAGHRLAWTMAAAGVLAVGVAIPLLHGRTAVADDPAANSPVAAVGHTGMTAGSPVNATPEQIARDNQMLNAIDRELDAPVDGTLASYAMEPQSSSTRGSHASVVRD